jgi:hypothetical protein
MALGITASVPFTIIETIEQNKFKISNGFGSEELFLLI